MIEKEVESVIRLNLSGPMSIQRFEKMMELQFREDYDRAMSHVVLMREEGFLEQDPWTISPNFSQHKVDGWLHPKGNKKKMTWL